MNPVVSIIFSKDRALQLRAMLESFFYHCEDSEILDINVLYKATNSDYARQYMQLQDEFPTVIFILENHLVGQIRAIMKPYQYIFFQVDDNISVAPFKISDALVALNFPGVLGFSYRLGFNTEYCYMLRENQAIPEMQLLKEPNIWAYAWEHAEYDFGYPLEVSSSIYRILDVLPYMTDKNVTSLVMVEGTLNRVRYEFRYKQEPNIRSARLLLACYGDGESRMFSLPLNNTSGHPENRAGEISYYTENDLALFFDNGKRIKVEDLYGITPNSCHQEFPIQFEERNERVE